LSRNLKTYYLSKVKLFEVNRLGVEHVNEDHWARAELIATECSLRSKLAIDGEVETTSVRLTKAIACYCYRAP
jgi:hypothetical protein